jgi:hypothetical protein
MVRSSRRAPIQPREPSILIFVHDRDEWLCFCFLVSSDETPRGRAGLCLLFHAVPLILLILSSLPFLGFLFVLLDVLNASSQGAFCVYNSGILIQSMMKKKSKVNPNAPPKYT